MKCPGQIFRSTVGWYCALGAALAIGLGVLGSCSNTGVRGGAANQPAINEGMISWPHEFRNSFLATIVFLGRRIDVAGKIDFHTWRDFRLTAATPQGKLLFDARVNWAGFHNLHTSAELPDSPVGTICRDVSLALRPPEINEPLKLKDGYAVATFEDAQLRHFTYYFNPTSKLLEKTTVQLANAFDTLTILFPQHDSRGWPMEMVFERPHRFYTITMTLNYGPVVLR